MNQFSIGFNLNQADAQLDEDNDQLYSNGYRIWPKQYVRNDYDDSEVDERQDNREYNHFMSPKTWDLFQQLLNNRIQTKQHNNNNNRPRYDEFYGTERFQQDPEDFSFNEDENVENNYVVEDETRAEDREIPEEESTLFDVVESDPTEFGYIPSDPRFYEPQTTVHKENRGEFYLFCNFFKSDCSKS